MDGIKSSFRGLVKTLFANISQHFAVESVRRNFVQKFHDEDDYDDDERLICFIFKLFLVSGLRISEDFRSTQHVGHRIHGIFNGPRH